MSTEKKVSLTVLLPAGRLPLDLNAEILRLAEKFSFNLYLSTLQNIRLTDVPENAVHEIKENIEHFGVQFKKPGLFPIPRVCVGKDHCNLGIIDTEKLSARILNRFKDRTSVKPKLKIAIAACALCCSGVKTTDIGIIRTQKGFDLYVGGKGGVSPSPGIRVGRNVDEEKILDMIETLTDYHDKKTKKKQRMFALLEQPDFPFAEQ